MIAAVGGRRLVSAGALPRLVAACALFAAAAAQDAPDPQSPAVTARERLVQRLRQLELPYTDWTLLRDVAEKVAAAGAAAPPVVALEVELARSNADPRYRVRLLGVQMAVEPQVAFDELAKVVEGDDEAVAALAARVLGRSRPSAARLDALVRERLLVEKRSSVRGALVLAAGEAGVRSLAPLLRMMLEKEAVVGPEVLWTWTALAQTADPGLVEASRLWLVPQSQFLGAAVLIARRFRDGDAERPLVRLLEVELSQPVATWVALGLGACGGDIGRKALRSAIAADEQARRNGAGSVSAAIDARQLALLRLGDKDARKWIDGAVARADTMLGSGIGRVPELFGRWRLDGASAQLAEWAGATQLPLLVRASAARGLCWLRDRRGLELAAALLGDEDVDSHAAAGINALQLLQRTLHEFVGDLARPDYRGFVLGDANKAALVGREWRAYLQQQAEGIAWREPGEDTEDLLYWH